MLLVLPEVDGAPQLEQRAPELDDVRQIIVTLGAEELVLREVSETLMALL